MTEVLKFPNEKIGYGKNFPTDAELFIKQRKHWIEHLSQTELLEEFQSWLVETGRVQFWED